MADMNEVATLLHIHEKAAAHGDLLKNIADHAMGQLRKINAEHIAPVVEEAPVEEEEPEHAA
jgi:hypothetical protein